MRLNQLYFLLSPNERVELAKRASLVPGYLWQIATRWRGKRPSIDAIQRLTVADPRLTLDDLLAEFAEPSTGAVGLRNEGKRASA